MNHHANIMKNIANQHRFMKYTDGFTIIETLVAIAILMIAVAGPLVVANKGLSAALYAKDQSIATFLAQEGMELVRNAKDMAIATNGSSPQDGFDEFFSTTPGNAGQCRYEGSNNNSCGIWVSDGSEHPPEMRRCVQIDQCRLYQAGSAGIGYTHDSSGNTPTIFSRFFYVNSIAGNNSEVQVTVVVSWNQGTVANAVTISSQMTATII